MQLDKLFIFTSLYLCLYPLVSSSLLFGTVSNTVYNANLNVWWKFSNLH